MFYGNGVVVDMFKLNLKYFLIIRNEAVALFHNNIKKNVKLCIYICKLWKSM